MPDAHATTTTPSATPIQEQTQQTSTKENCPEPTPAPTPPPKDDDSCEPCPKPKPCAEWPKPECPPPRPDPCADDDDDCDPPEDTPPVATGDCCALPSADDPLAQLALLQQHLLEEQRQAEQLERVKTSIEDLTGRITELQKMLEGKPALASAFRDFYRTTEVTKSEILCFIPTVRCQLNLTDADRACIRNAISAADDAIARAKADLEAQKARVERYDRRHARAAWKLDRARMMYEFFSTKLKDGIQAKRDDLAALKALADPSKNQCLAEFYLREMEAQLKSCYGTGKNECCFPPADVTIGSFLDCWSYDCYLAAYSRAVVEFNEAEWAEKCRKTLLDAATKRVTDLQKTYDDLVAKRRETILASLKASECCKSC